MALSLSLGRSRIDSGKVEDCPDAHAHLGPNDQNPKALTRMPSSALIPLFLGVRFPYKPL